MKCFFALAFVLTVTSFAQEKPLSEIDRELLLEKLKQIQENSDSTVKGRFGVALAAFKKARESDAAAHALYLNCVEKIRFEDEAKKASEFREWKNRHKEKTDSSGFRLALRHQLNWLVLSLEASQTEDITKMSSKGVAVLDAILRDAEKLKGQEALLKSSALNSIFAKAYDISKVKVSGWPESPLAISSIYDSVVLPPLRSPQTLAALRQGWLKRIEQEGLLLEQWTDEGSADKSRKPAFDKWLRDGRQKLTWNMEVDLFRNGDQRNAALRMLEHLKSNLTHESAPQWIKQFKGLVEVTPAKEDAKVIE